MHHYMVQKTICVTTADVRQAQVSSQGYEDLLSMHCRARKFLLQCIEGEDCYCGPQVHEKYPDIEYSETIVDNACMQLVKNPAQFDVLVRRHEAITNCT